MEAKSPSKAQCLSSDIITTLPQSITEIILCFLPIKEAARTSILSRDWRYKWTTIPKLVFDWTTVFDITTSRRNMDPDCKLFYAIHQVLLLHNGPIDDFTLVAEADYKCFELDQIILHLSRNHTLKKLSLDLADEHFYKLPLCAFSLHQLTDLDLSHIDLGRQPIFGGFGNLRSLRLFDVNISTKALLHLLSNCPSLTSFTLLDYRHIYDDQICSGILEGYSDVSLEHLEELEIDYFSNMKPEMEFVKFILASSPKLKKVWIWCVDGTLQQELEMLKILLRGQCVSPAEIFVEIDVE